MQLTSAGIKELRADLPITCLMTVAFSFSAAATFVGLTLPGFHVCTQAAVRLSLRDCLLGGELQQYLSGVLGRNHARRNIEGETVPGWLENTVLSNTGGEVWVAE